MLFEDWYTSFQELLPILGLPPIELSATLRLNMKAPSSPHPRDMRRETQRHQQDLSNRRQEQWYQSQIQNHLYPHTGPNSRHRPYTNHQTSSSTNQNINRELPNTALTGANLIPITSRAPRYRENMDQTQTPTFNQAPLTSQQGPI